MVVATEVVEVVLIVCGAGGLVASAGLGLASRHSRVRTISKVEDGKEVSSHAAAGGPEDRKEG